MDGKWGLVNLEPLARILFNTLFTGRNTNLSPKIYVRSTNDDPATCAPDVAFNCGLLILCH